MACTAGDSVTGDDWAPGPEYDYTKSTAENYRDMAEPDRPFEGRFGPVRATRDYTYHTRYCESRERLQDVILSRILDNSVPDLHPGKTMCRLASCDGDDDDTNSPQEVDHHSCKSVKMSPRRPFIVFMAGGMGVGKSYALRWAYNKGYFDTSRYVMVDPDRLKCMLPEMRELIRRDRSTAGTLTHAESTYIAEIAQECALQEGKNIIVDGSLRDWRWYQTVFEKLHRDRPQYRIAIIKVTCRRETMFARADARGKVTGRDVPRELLEASYDAVDESVEKLSPFCELVFEIDTEGADPVITSITVSGKKIDPGADAWGTFASAWRREERLRA